MGIETFNVKIIPHMHSNEKLKNDEIFEKKKLIFFIHARVDFIKPEFPIYSQSNRVHK